MPDQTIKVMNASALKLALQYYNDATMFIQIMEANHLDDWVINGPVIVSTQAPNFVGDTLLVLETDDDIKIGALCYCAGLDTYATVLNVQQVFSTPAGLPFAQCPAEKLFAQRLAAPVRVLPPSGTWISTNVTLSQGLDLAMDSGTAITFASAVQTEIIIPSAPAHNLRGIPT